MKKAVQKNAVIGVSIDKEKLREAADRYLSASSVFSAVKSLATFSWNDVPSFWRNIVGLVNVVISAVEVAKAELLDGQPEGTKISGAIACQVAVDILDQSITFTGAVGRLIEVVDGVILKLLVNLVLGERHSVDWITQAFEILGLKEN